MSLVLDCSTTLSWCFEDERDPASLLALERVGREGAVVPTLWRYEVGNGLLVAQRRELIDGRRRMELLAQLAELSIRTDAGLDEHLWVEVSDLAVQHGLTIYDAAYLELARRLRLPLASHDGRLRRAAESIGISFARFSSRLIKAS